MQSYGIKKPFSFLKGFLKQDYDRLTIDHDAGSLGGYLTVLVVDHVHLVGTAGLTRDADRDHRAIAEAAGTLGFDHLSECIVDPDLQLRNDIGADTDVEVALVRARIDDDGREFIDAQVTLGTLVHQDGAYCRRGTARNSYTVIDRLGAYTGNGRIERSTGYAGTTEGSTRRGSAQRDRVI